MTRTRKLLAVTGIAAVLAAGGGVAIAAAQQDPGDPDLDRAADVARNTAGSGDITSVEQDDNGTYEVEIRHPDGTETDVGLDASFAVTATRTDRDPDRDDDADVSLDATTRERVATAALAAAGDGTVTDIEGDDGGYEVEIRHADGTESDVHLAADLTVLTTEHDVDD